MKKLVFVSIVLNFIFIYSAQCQKFEFGIKTGPVISNIGLSDLVSHHVNPDKPDIWFHYFTAKVGFNISLNIAYNISSKFFVGFEPGYILKGANFSDSESKLDLHYLNLPMIIQYNIGEKTNIYFGPEFSYLLNAELDFDGDKIDMDNFYNEKTETSIFLGVNYFISNGLGIGIRFNYGLTKVSETVWLDEAGNLIGKTKENNYYSLLYMSIIMNKLR